MLTSISKLNFTHTVLQEAKSLPSKIVEVHIFDFSSLHSPISLACLECKDVVVILTGHAAVRKLLNIMGLFKGDPTCRLCRKGTETVQHIICCCEALDHQCYFLFGNPFVKPKDISQPQ
jgi:hypothetical protein